MKFAPGVTLVDSQFDCIKAALASERTESFAVKADERGQAFLFERFRSPAVFMEVMHTLPHKIRGNHVHQNCAEALHVISGEVEVYVLCEHGKHVFRRVVREGESIVTPKGVPHASYSAKKSECVVIFDQDPRIDRARVAIIQPS